MSTLSRLLRRSFSTTTAAFQSPSIKSLAEDLYKERDLKRLVHKFKLCSSSDRFRAKSGIYDTTVRRLAAAKRFRWIQEILDYQLQFREDASRENFTVRIIKLYGQSGMFESAKKVFDEMPERDCERTVVSVNALLSACVNSRKFDEVKGVFKEMERKWKVTPDVVSYNIVIKGLCEMGEFDRALKVFEAMGGNGVSPDLITLNTLLEKLYKNKRFDDGEKTWKRMVDNDLLPNIRSYNARVVGLVNEKKFGEAVELVSEMGKSGISPDVFTYAAMIKGFCDAGDLGEVKKWYAEMVKSGHEPYRALLGDILLCACNNGDYDWCFELCEALFARKCLVDAAVLQKVVDQFAKGSRIEEAKKVVQMGNSNDYCLYKLKLASEE